jgi:hypothetical protein
LRNSLAEGTAVVAAGTWLSRLIAHTRRWRVALPVLAIVWGAYLGILHPWLMNWGATAQETTAALPGDADGAAPYFTRAISVEAPPSAVWPWIVQMGQDRGGFYSNTWLENLTGADIHNADAVHPEWQQRALGDRVLLARPDLLGGRLAHVSHTEIVMLQRESVIANTPGRFVLRRAGEHATRLLVRESIRDQGPLLTRWLAWDPIHFVMVQRMLRGIKERVEGRALVPGWMVLTARAGWTVAFGFLLVAFVARRPWWPWLTLPVAPAWATLSATGDAHAAIAGFLAVGITIAGALAFGRRWWPTYTLLAATVLLVLLLAPDAYTAFGLGFDLAAVAVGAAALSEARR